MMGDLNLHRLRPLTKQGKLLLDLEMVQGFECVIKQPTRMGRRGTTTSAPLIDALLTIKSGLFIGGGIFYPALSDHMLIYGITKEKMTKHSLKVYPL